MRMDRRISGTDHPNHKFELLSPARLLSVFWYNDLDKIPLVEDTGLWSSLLNPKSGIFVFLLIQWFTLPETNIAPEKRPSQKETSIPTIHFQVLCWFQGG